MSSLALRTLGAAVLSVATGAIADAIITTENNLVILRVPLVGMRLFWSPDKARQVATSLIRMADRIDLFRDDTGVAKEKSMRSKDGKILASETCIKRVADHTDFVSCNGRTLPGNSYCTVHRVQKLKELRRAIEAAQAEVARLEAQYDDLFAEGQPR